MKADVHALQRDRKTKAKHLLHRAGYKTGGKVRVGGGNAEHGVLPADPPADLAARQYATSGGKVRHLGRRHRHKISG